MSTPYIIWKSFWWRCLSGPTGTSCVCISAWLFSNNLAVSMWWYEKTSNLKYIKLSLFRHFSQFTLTFKNFALLYFWAHFHNEHCQCGTSDDFSGSFHKIIWNTLGTWHFYATRIFGFVNLDAMKEEFIFGMKIVFTCNSLRSNILINNIY